MIKDAIHFSQCLFSGKRYINWLKQQKVCNNLSISKFFYINEHKIMIQLQLVLEIPSFDENFRKDV